MKNYDIGMLVLVANENWKAASWLLISKVWLFGEHEKFSHLGKRLHITFFNETPYLLRISVAHSS